MMPCHTGHLVQTHSATTLTALGQHSLLSGLAKMQNNTRPYELDAWMAGRAPFPSGALLLYVSSKKLRGSRIKENIVHQSKLVN